MSGEISEIYEFGPFRLDAAERVLVREGRAVHLTPKEFETLLALVRNSGRVMEKERLLKEVWPDTFVEEATLAQNVFTLRKALGKADGEGQYIETVPRRGYRFAAEVRASRREETAPSAGAGRRVEFTARGAGQDDADTSDYRTRNDGAKSDGGNGINPADADEQADRDASGAPRGFTSAGVASSSEARGKAHRIRLAALLVVAVLVFVIIVAAGLFLFRQFINPAPGVNRQATFQSMKVTRLPVAGNAREAVISPDGKYVAYVSDEGGAPGVWVRLAATASNAQRIAAPADARFIGALVFSRDSDHLYYGVLSEGGTEAVLYEVPVLGGASRKMIENINSPVTFSPDGKRAAFIRRVDGGEAFALLITNTDGSDERRLAVHKSSDVFNLPAWSPDGKVIACITESGDNAGPGSFITLTVVDVAGGSEKPLTGNRWDGAGQPVWLSDGSGLVVNASENELSPSQLWHVAYPGGEVRRITNDLNSYQGASITADSGTLVTVQTDRMPNIWTVPEGDAGRAVQLTTGTGRFDGYYGIAWTPDGRIVYSSIASGDWDIWMMEADGSNKRQLTIGTRSNYGPAVSPDGRYIVFVSNRAGGAFNVWRMDADGRNPVRLTRGDGENFVHVTPDGRWVVYASVGNNQRHFIWKAPIDGGDPVAITDKPSSWPVVSTDGKFVACTYQAEPNAPEKLALVPIEGGPPVKLFDLAPSFAANTCWMPDGRGIAFLAKRGGTGNVWVQPPDGGKPVQLTDFRTDGIVAYDWSADGKRLACARSVETTGIVLIKDFR
ncbi:MAG TPA: winged helix-turn-helix domain-containing protein [Pyrinomonadaceae bacterium]|nr:winged helix-turn-helix domain-containing protein [Pyrinomonadaceae bacterium]